MIRDTSAMDHQVQAPSRLRRWWPVAAAVVGLGVVGGLAAPKIGLWLRSERSIDASRLRTGVVRRGDLVVDVHVPGRLASAEHPTLFSVAPGIVDMKVRPGELVTRGQVLAVVHSTALESQLKQERATLASLRSEYDRQRITNRQQRLSHRQSVDLAGVAHRAAAREQSRNEHMLEQGLISQRDVDKARDDTSVAALELEHAKQTMDQQSEVLAFELRDRKLRVERQQHVVAELEQRLADLEVRSPVDGLVAELLVDDRDAVGERQPLVEVVDLSVFEVALEIPEMYADDVFVGAAAEVTIDGRVANAVVSRVAPSVSGGRVSGTATFRDEQPEGLRQNQRVSVRIVLDTRTDVVIAPRGAYVDAGGRSVFVVRDGVARRAPIALGAVGIRDVEVASGLSAGDEIVLSDVSELADADTAILH